MSGMKCLSRNKSRVQTTKLSGIEFRTEDKLVDLDADWMYRNQMMEICEYMGVGIIWLRSDCFRSYAGTSAITVNPPTTADRLKVVAHEAAHVGFRHIGFRFDRHRMEFETGMFETTFLRYSGIEPTAKQIVDGKLYVANLIRMAIRRGIKKFDREAWNYARSTELPEYFLAVLDSIEPNLIDKSQNNGFREAMSHFAGVMKEEWCAGR